MYSIVLKNSVFSPSLFLLSAPKTCVFLLDGKFKILVKVFKID